VLRRSRLLAFGAAAALVLAGLACAALVPGVLGGALATALIGIGLVLATSLVFFEIGLSEDRERELEADDAHDGRPPSPAAGADRAPHRARPPEQPESRRLPRRRRIPRRPD
jgi:hypothetical protein